MPARRDHETKLPQRSNVKKNAPRKFFFERWAEKITGLSEHFAIFALIAVILFLVADVYLIASLLSELTGSVGRSAREVILTNAGGGAIFMLFFVLYVCMSLIFGRKVPRPFNQTVGVLLLYFCVTLTLGLLQMPPTLFRPRIGSVFEAGAAGIFVAGWLYVNLGPLGTTLVGMTAISFTLYFFGFTSPFESAYHYLAERLRNLLEREERADEDTDTDADTDADGETAEETGANAADRDETPEKNEPDPPRVSNAEASGDDLGKSETDLPVQMEVIPVDEMPPDEGPGRTKPGQFPPPFEVYGRADDDDGGVTVEMARPWGERIISSLNEFGVEAELADILIGPTVIQFRVQPFPGVKVQRIVSLANDLAMTLAVASLRVEAPIPGHPYVGIEIPNPKRRGITLRSIIEEDAYQETDRTLPLPMGVTINGDPLITGLEDLPHLLVAGTTGSGKSVFVNACIVGLCSMRRPNELKMVLVDPKRVEMAVYEKLPHILTPPVTDPKKAVHALAWAIREMERRYSLFAASRVRNLQSYNEIVIPKDRLPNIVIVVDELADLMMTAAKEVEEYICRLAQMARATGIHLMLATQRPSVNVITGLIKANVPARVAFTLPTMMDSRTIIDSGGAEKLLGKGDMLFLSTQNPKPVRVQSPWIDERSISRWLDYLVNMFGEPIYTDIDEQGEAPAGFDEESSYDDPLFEEAVKVVISSGMASASGLQRRLRVGFTRAGRIVDMMESAGIIGPADGARPRDILVDEDGADEILQKLGVAK
ncbi:MAG: DNA translocase FtsK [Synergistaceae bacterium]|jgi:S-DNA-T family DNA segregation ATPase FtsK/SpoIIIE|nr:DNA translocase FtsK [Synergistaceae bacterium]